jgi:CBS domain-containing protein
MTVARILAAKGRDVFTTQPHRTLGEAAQVLSYKDIGALVVTDAQGTVLGILSERDVVRAVGRKGVEALNDAVSLHMTTKVVTTTADQTVMTTIEQMNAGRFRHLPVLENSKLAGIVSIGDIVKYRLAQMEHEQSAMREYIATA